jgi:phenylpyruvate tautomerase PptA (4-oxalocrotonate tautomerase family)
MPIDQVTHRRLPMPQVTVFNLSKEDALPAIAEAISRALTSMPELGINAQEVDLVPVLAPGSFEGATTRINVDLWEHEARTKEALQELASRLAAAFQDVTATSRKVKVVIRPYDVGRSGWVSL